VEEVFCAGQESQYSQSAYEEQSLAPSEAEMLIVGGHWLSSSQLRFYTQIIGYSQKDTLVLFVIGMYKGSKGRFLELFALL